MTDDKVARELRLFANKLRLCSLVLKITGTDQLWLVCVTGFDSWTAFLTSYLQTATECRMITL